MKRMVMVLVVASCGGDSSANCDMATLKCSEAATTADLTAVFGVAPTTYDENGHPNCNIKLPSGGGGIQVFCGDQYADMVGGANAGYPGAVTEPNNVGRKTFEVLTADIVEVGFLTTNGQYSVLVNLITGAADITKARALAMTVDTNLSTP
jgi:hypothetical protein